MYKFIRISSTSLLLSLLLTACGGESDSTQEKSENENLRAYIPTEVTDNTARSFLEKSTFGADAQAVSDLERLGIEKWVDEQLNAPSAYDSNTDAHKTYLESTIDAFRQIDPGNASYTTAEYVDTTNDININGGHGSRRMKHAFISAWFENALDGKDQLRQRMTYALSQILVVSSSSDTLGLRRESLAVFCDILAKNAFGNYRDLLFNVTKSGAMGVYLTYLGNQKYNPDTYRQPDENYAREVMQLFTIGLEQLHLDGTPIFDSKGEALQTYTISDIEEMSRIFTGWGMADIWYGGIGVFTKPMEFHAEYHDDGNKTVLGHTIKGVGGDEELRAIIEVLVNYPSTAPYLSKQLIQRLVTSNPTPAYVERVAKVFRDNGSGVSGDMKAVLRAILLDEEVFKEHEDSEYFGKAKEPMMAFIQMLRAFNVEHKEGEWTESIISNRQTISNMYVFATDQVGSFGQGPLMSPSVFNFYQADFIIADDDFKSKGIATPELQIQTAQQLVNYSKTVINATKLYEKLLQTQGVGSIDRQLRVDKYSLSFEEEFELAKSIIGYETDEDYTKLNIAPYKENVINTLVDSLNDKLVAGKMNENEVALIKEHFIAIDCQSERDLVFLIHNIVNTILTSSSYMIQK